MKRQEVVARSMTGAAISDFLALMWAAVLAIILLYAALTVGVLYLTFLFYRKMYRLLRVGWARYKEQPEPTFVTKTPARDFARKLLSRQPSKAAK